MFQMMTGFKSAEAQDNRQKQYSSSLPGSKSTPERVSLSETNDYEHSTKTNPMRTTGKAGADAAMESTDNISNVRAERIYPIQRTVVIT